LKSAPVRVENGHLLAASYLRTMESFFRSLGPRWILARLFPHDHKRTAEILRESNQVGDAALLYGCNARAALAKG